MSWRIIGAIFYGAFAIFSLVELVRAVTQYRKLRRIARQMNAEFDQLEREIDGKDVVDMRRLASDLNAVLDRADRERRR